MTSLENIKNEKQAALAKWKGIIADMNLGVEESFLPELALLLENQRLYNETAKVNDDEGTVFIEIVAKMYSRTIARHIVSFQSMPSPANLVFYQKYEYKNPRPIESPSDGTLEIVEYDAPEDNTPLEVELVLKEESVVARTRKLKALTYEGCCPDEIATMIADEISREIITDIRNNCGTIASWEWTKTEDLIIKIMEISGVVYRKTLRGGVNWIIASEFLGKQLMESYHMDAPEMNGTGIYKIGCLNGAWTLYIDRLLPEGTLVMGFRDREIDENPYWQYNAGYFYCPYVPLAKTPLFPNEILGEHFCPRPGLLTRYGKKLLKEGAKYYARLNVSGIPFHE